MAQGDTLSEVTDAVRAGFGIRSAILPASNDPVRTMVTTTDGSRLTFREYFVDRGHQDHVKELDFDGAAHATPAPGVIDVIDAADLVVIGPSNPPLSIWPILAIEPIDQAVRRHANVIAVSPLIGGRTLKGPADVVMADLGLGTGSNAVLASYEGLIHTLVVDTADSADEGDIGGVRVVALETRIAGRDDAANLARAILNL